MVTKENNPNYPYAEADGAVPVEMVYDMYTNYCKRSGETPISAQDFENNASIMFGPVVTRCYAGTDKRVYTKIPLHPPVLH